MRSVVVGVDGSPESAAALAYAVDAALARHASLEIVHVLDPEDTAPPDPHAPGPMLVDAIARRLLLGHPQLRVATSVTSGDPARALIARSTGAELLVVGAAPGRHGHRSVSRAVLRRAACPVVVVPAA